jgi:MinD superfamily P-loop ATPase
MILAIASGKGGTGKTTLAVNLASVADAPVQLLDCDVEEPNAHLFLEGFRGRQEVVSVPIPAVDMSRCDGCGECSRFCQYHAIANLKARPLVFPELCHSCGGCVLVCPRKALSETRRRIGVVEVGALDGITLVQGRIDVGVAQVPPLIRAVKSRLRPEGLAIVDAPPGTSCPVVAALRGADVVVLVTEPTPFGLHDLDLAVDVVREMRIPFGVAVNRVGAGDDRVHVFCRQNDIPILIEIPDDRRVAEAYSRGELAVEAVPEYRCLFETLLARAGALARVAGHPGPGPHGRPRRATAATRAASEDSVAARSERSVAS